MAKYIELEEDIEKMFEEAFRATELDLVLTMKVIAVDKQTEVIKPMKATDIVKYLNSIDLFMFVNQEVFQNLEEVSQRVLVEEAIAQVKFDVEKERLKIDKGDIHTPSLFLQKHSLETYLSVKHNVTQVLEQMKETNNNE